MLRAAIRPVHLAARSVRPVSAARALSISAVRRSDHAAPPPLFPPGSKAGEVPNDFEHATGLERLELLGEIEGVKVFDYDPLDSSRIGTLADPIKVLSWDSERIIGCTGSPAESHELHWMTLKSEKNRRCPECGSVYELDFQGEKHHDAHHH
ncbi:hypothetical protein EW026_g1255 [Hermanssonia centrifuga]|uniref:C2H2-type domain-containing protein n=1 Tax=Hermanssonia centrifuga TaxID=98765 RepID=A0A4S4KS56_9APHY|nr:hypothetical protein EW026_g1255 [Hermanssonia centrifuga]